MTAEMSAAERRERLVEVYKQARGCTRCEHLAETRIQVVFGAGNADADLMFIGEGPGAEEDRQGLPFVGRAGGLLNKLLEEVGLERSDVFIANTIKCRPPGNRDPQPVEIENCRPYLEQQIDLIRPRVVATLGNFATKLIADTTTGITKMRGNPLRRTVAGVELWIVPLFHPAAALRDPRRVEDLRVDMKTVRDLLDAPVEGLESISTGEAPAGPAPTGADKPASPDTDQLGIFG